VQSTRDIPFGGGLSLLSRIELIDSALGRANGSADATVDAVVVTADPSTLSPRRGRGGTLMLSHSFT